MMTWGKHGRHYSTHFDDQFGRDYYTRFSVNELRDKVARSEQQEPFNAFVGFKNGMAIGLCLWILYRIFR